MSAADERDPSDAGVPIPAEVGPCAGPWELLGITRREFLIQAGIATATLAAFPLLRTDALAREVPAPGAAQLPPAELVPVHLTINGRDETLHIDPRVTLLDALRERLDLKGTKKGCDHGQCGACTVLVNDRRINSCLALAVMHDGATVRTIEGLAQGDTLHPVQAAFIEHDGFQCGYCTPGQICSAVALLDEINHGWLSAASKTIRDPRAALDLSDDELRERMSGNLCRCGAYNGIIAAIREARAHP